MGLEDSSLKAYMELESSRFTRIKNQRNSGILRNGVMQVPSSKKLMIVVTLSLESQRVKGRRDPEKAEGAKTRRVSHVHLSPLLLPTPRPPLMLPSHESGLSHCVP